MTTILPGTTRTTRSTVPFANLFRKGAGLLFRGSTSGEIGLLSPATPTSYNLTLPTAVAAVTGYVLQSTDAGVLSWVAQTPASSPAGSGTEIQYRNAGAFGAVAETSYAAGTLLFTSGAAGTIPLAIKAHASQSGNLTEWRISTDAVKAKVTSSGSFSNSQGQSSSEVFGDGAYNSAANCTTFGYGARCTNVGGVCSAFGRICLVSGSASFTFGDDNTVSGSASQSMGYQANIAHNGCTVFGYGVSSTAANQFIAGGAQYPINNVYFGKGVTNATPTAWTLNGTGGSGTNIVGGNLIIAPGPSTGTGTPSAVIIQSSVATTSGTTAQTLANTLTVTNSTVSVSSVAASGAAFTVIGNNNVSLNLQEWYRSVALGRVAYVNPYGTAYFAGINSTAGITCDSAVGLTTDGWWQITGNNPAIFWANREFRLTQNQAGYPLTIHVANSEIARFAATTRFFGILTNAPDRQVEINAADGQCLRLTYNDANGSATYYTDLAVSAAGNLTVTPSGGSLSVAADLNMGLNTVHFGTSESTQTPAGTTATISIHAGNHHTLDCGSASGDVTLTLTVPPGPCAGTLVIKQGATARDITWTPSAGAVKWLGTEPTWNLDTSKYRLVAWRWDGAILFLSATDTD